MDWIHHDCNYESSSSSPSKNGVPISQAVADWHLLEVRGWWAWSWGQECWMLVRVMIIMIMWTMIILMMIKKRQRIQSDNYQVGPDHMHHPLRHHRSDHHWSLADCRFGEIDWDLALEIYCHQNCSYIYIRLLLLSILIFLRDQVFHRSLQQGQLLDSSTKSGCEIKKTYHWKCIRTKSEEYNEFDITLNRDIKEQIYHKKLPDLWLWPLLVLAGVDHPRLDLHSPLHCLWHSLEVTKRHLFSFNNVDVCRHILPRGVVGKYFNRKSDLNLWLTFWSPASSDVSSPEKLWYLHVFISSYQFTVFLRNQSCFDKIVR